MIPDPVIEFISQGVSNQLHAHGSDLAEEMAGDEKGRATIVFRVRFEKLGDKVLGRIKTTIPHQATHTECLLPDFRQTALPGM